MASSYTTTFAFEKITTGEQSGSWGTSTNHTWDVADRIGSHSAVALTGTTHTLTVRAASPTDGAAHLQEGQYRSIKFTGALGANNTVTIAPNTSACYWLFENATTDSGSSGPYSVIISQGSGANVTVQNGKNALVYSDGGGGSAAVYNALSDLQIDTLECTGAAAIDGAATLGSSLSVATTSTLTGVATAVAGVVAAKEDSAANTVLNTVNVKRTTSHSTPASGIGSGIEFTTETATDNNEVGTVLESVSTAVGSTSEAFDFVVKNMAGGSAAAEVARVTSAGVLSSQGGMTAIKSDSGTTTIISPITVKRNTTGTAAAGIGAGIDFEVETTPSNDEIGGVLKVLATSVSGGAENFDMTFNLMASGATAAELMRLESTGYLGIGKTGPTSQLHIAKSSQADITAYTYAATVTPVFQNYQNFSTTLTGNVTLANPASADMLIGLCGSFFITQDGTGSRLLSAVGTYWHFPGGTLPTLTTTAAAVDRIDFIIVSASSVHAVASLDVKATS
jgi:hypothetical protein